MNLAIELHDSKIEELVWNRNGIGSLLLRAVLFRSLGLPFHNAQESGWQGVRFYFEGMTLEGGFNSDDPYLYGGELWENGAPQPIAAAYTCRSRDKLLSL